MKEMGKNNQMPCISVVVPVFNSEETIIPLYKRLISVLRNLTDEYEIIFVNDASVDGSSNVIKVLGKKDPKIIGIDLMRNFGQHNALLCGIRRAKYQYIVTLDDDLQNPPEEIPKLIDKINEGYDVVYGTPDKEQHGFLRNLASITTKVALKKVMEVESARHASTFRIFRTKLRDAFKHFNSSFVIIDVLLTWGTRNFSSIIVKHYPRQSGKSNYSFKQLVIISLNMITGFSILPLQIASILGFTFAIFGIFILLYVLCIFLIMGSGVPGFPFIASIIAIFSGVQLLAVGIIGEYLARMHFRLMGKPQYIESDNT